MSESFQLGGKYLHHDDDIEEWARHVLPPYWYSDAFKAREPAKTNLFSLLEVDWRTAYLELAPSLDEVVIQVLVQY